MYCSRMHKKGWLRRIKKYPLPNGQSVRLLEDNNVYLGNQIEISGSDRCYGVVADEAYVLVCEYGCGGEKPQIILYKKR